MSDADIHPHQFQQQERWRLEWEYGSAEVQALGGMLAPLHLRLDPDRDLQIMHVAPWAGTTESLALPGLLRRMRGEWPCVPFGRTDAPADLPSGWSAMAADDPWSHGYGANHRWTCTAATATSVSLAIDYPESAPIASMTRCISVVPGAPALDIGLTIRPRRDTRLPAGLHPTFRLPQPAGRVQVVLGRHDGIFSYPSHSAGAGAASILLPDTRSARLDAIAGVDGPCDLSRLPPAGQLEELLQVRALAGTGHLPPFTLHYLDYDMQVGLWWDTRHFPDLMLWLSNRGRPDAPWHSRHVALGAEPVNSLFDLGRVATPPAAHPLADRCGIALRAGQEWTTHYRIAAWPAASPVPAALAPRERWPTTGP